MNRRDFLEPSCLARSAGNVWGAVQTLSEAEEAKLQAPYSFLRFHHKAMATDWEFVIPFGIAGAMEAADLAFARIDELEDQLSVYRSHSEVSRLNQQAPDQAVVVETGLFDLLHLAQRLSEATDGAFDVAAGALIRAWGYLRGPRRVPDHRELAQALSRVGMKHVQLNANQKSVRFLRQGLEINLGAIGKGYAIDQAIEKVRARGHDAPVLLHGGHSSVYAIGSEPGTDCGWLIDIGHPAEPGKSLGTLRLRDGAMGTSAATFQYLEHHGRKLGHILDPRTGWPGSGVQSVSVIAASAAVADALATAFFIMGSKRVEGFCRSHEDIGVVLLSEGSEKPQAFGRLAESFRSSP